jgi:hypothetical protein
VDIASHQREKLERLCRYVSRPPVASERLALTASGQVRYTLKTPYRDGTTHIVLEPLDLMARLAALVPTPRMHLTRYHGVFAPHSQYRAAVTPAQRGRGAATPPSERAAARGARATAAGQPDVNWRMSSDSVRGRGGGGGARDRAAIRGLAGNELTGRSEEAGLWAAKTGP